MDEGIFQNKRKGGKLGNSYLNVRYKIVLSTPTPKEMVIFNAMHRGVVNQGKYQNILQHFLGARNLFAKFSLVRIVLETLRHYYTFLRRL